MGKLNSREKKSVKQLKGETKAYVCGREINFYILMIKNHLKFALKCYKTNGGSICIDFWKETRQFLKSLLKLGV